MYLFVLLHLLLCHFSHETFKEDIAGFYKDINDKVERWVCCVCGTRRFTCKFVHQKFHDENNSNSYFDIVDHQLFVIYNEAKNIRYYRESNLRVCNKCDKCITKKKIAPRFCKKNGYCVNDIDDYGDPRNVMFNDMSHKPAPGEYHRRLPHPAACLTPTEISMCSILLPVVKILVAKQYVASTKKFVGHSVLVNNASSVELLSQQVQTLPRHCDDKSTATLLIGMERCAPHVLADVNKRQFRIRPIMKCLLWLKKYNKLYANIIIDYKYIKDNGLDDDDAPPTMIDKFLKGNIDH